MKKTKKINLKILLAIVLILVLASALTIDTSELSHFSPDLAFGVVKGLFSPDWGFLYDGSGEDLASLLVVTLAIAFVGTVIGAILAFPLSLFSAYNLWGRKKYVSKIGKGICDLLRAFPELIIAIIFVKMVGPGAFAGVMAIGVHQIGMMGKLFAEEMEGIDESPVEAMSATGATFMQTLGYARIPQLVPIYVSFILNHFEIALRSAAILGLVGAGGIGAPLIFAIQSRNWGKVSIILIGIILTVFAVDSLTAAIRKKLH